MKCRMWMLYLLVAMLSPHSLAGQTHIVYWNRTNPNFASGLSSWEINVRVNDVIKVVCPFIGEAASLIDDDYDEEEAANHLIIHSVDEMAYLNCVLDSSKREVSVCDSPREGKIVFIPIRKYSPHPISFEFRPGSIYYWISTSSGSSTGIGFQHYGLCRDENMRLAIRVSETMREETSLGIPSPASQGAIPPTPAQHMKMVLGWMERGLQGTFTFSPDEERKLRLGAVESAWDAVPMSAEEVIADARENYDLPDPRNISQGYKHLFFIATSLFSQPLLFYHHNVDSHGSIIAAAMRDPILPLRCSTPLSAFSISQAKPACAYSLQPSIVAQHIVVVVDN